MKIKDLSFLSIRRIPSQEFKSRLLYDMFRLNSKFQKKMDIPLGAVWYNAGMKEEFEKENSSSIKYIEEWLETELTSDEVSDATVIIF